MTARHDTPDAQVAGMPPRFAVLPGSTNAGPTKPGSTRPGSTKPGSAKPGSAKPGPASNEDKGAAVDGSMSERMSSQQGALLQNLEIMQAHHARLLDLCDQLEDLADNLPDRIDVSDCLRTARSLVPAVRAAHRFEEHVFFPMAQSVMAQSAGAQSAGPQSERGQNFSMDEALSRLRGEHREDESFAEEAAEALMDWGMGSDRRGPETTGYMLRGLFETLRRHIAFERAVLIQPLIPA